MSDFKVIFVVGSGFYVKVMVIQDTKSREYVPGISNVEVPEYVDKEFIGEEAMDSFALPVGGDLMHLSGFSYTNLDEIGVLGEDGASLIVPSSPSGLVEVILGEDVMDEA
jgi:hypothetical protein